MEEEIIKKQGLKPFNAVIQVCKLCGKVDAYAGDNHNCDFESEKYREESNEYYE